MTVFKAFQLKMNKRDNKDMKIIHGVENVIRLVTSPVLQIKHLDSSTHLKKKRFRTYIKK